MAGGVEANGMVKRSTSIEEVAARSQAVRRDGSSWASETLAERVEAGARIGGPRLQAALSQVLT
jgi:hypothetical protein